MMVWPGDHQALTFAAMVGLISRRSLALLRNAEFGDRVLRLRVESRTWRDSGPELTPCCSLKVSARAHFKACWDTFSTNLRHHCCACAIQDFWEM